MSTLICGSVAYDNIMVFQDRFKDCILPEQIHILNVCFLVPEIRRVFGGCAGNIAYNLKLLGGDPIIMATVGEDSGPYLTRLDDLGLPRDHVTCIPGSFTAQAFITTDLDDNQITAFHPGAMNFSHQNHVADIKDKTLAIVAPDGRDGMLKHARDLAAAGTPFIFDPGQQLPMFSPEELLEFVTLADYVCFNDYEAKMFCDRTGRTIDELAGMVKALVITLGGDGSLIHADGQRIEIPCVQADAVVDPTGCGDAYRSGLLYGIAKGWAWEKTGNLAAVMGAIKVAHQGCQNHQPTRDDIASRYQAAFGYAPW